MKVRKVFAMKCLADISILVNVKFTGKVAYALQKNTVILKKIYDDYEHRRMALIRKHTPKGEDGTFIIKDNKYAVEDVDLFNHDLNLVLNETVDIKLMYINVVDIQYTSMTPQQIQALLFMLCEDGTISEVLIHEQEASKKVYS